MYQAHFQHSVTTRGWAATLDSAQITEQPYHCGDFHQRALLQPMSGASCSSKTINNQEPRNSFPSLHLSSFLTISTICHPDCLRHDGYSSDKVSDHKYLKLIWGKCDLLSGQGAWEQSICCGVPGPEGLIGAATHPPPAHAGDWISLWFLCTSPSCSEQGTEIWLLRIEGRASNLIKGKLKWGRSTFRTLSSLIQKLWEPLACRVALFPGGPHTVRKRSVGRNMGLYVSWWTDTDMEDYNCVIFLKVSFWLPGTSFSCWWYDTWNACICERKT